jgi:MFS family permease
MTTSTPSLPVRENVLAEPVSVSRAVYTLVILSLIFNLVGQIVAPLAAGWLNELLEPSFGETAIRYSLLISPISMAIGAVVLLVLAGHFKEDRRAVEISPTTD